MTTKYDQVMAHGIRFRVTDAQANSLTAIANAMSLTVGDVIRAAVDQWVEDIPEPAVFRTRIRIVTSR